MRNEGLFGDNPFEMRVSHQLRHVVAETPPNSRRYWRILAVFPIVCLVMTALLHTSGSHQSQRDVVALGPQLPYIIYGYSYDGFGNPIPYCTVNITNKNTSESVEISSSGIGYYQFNLANLPSGYVEDNIVNISTSDGSSEGWNQTSVTGSGGKWLNVTLPYAIPEFSEIFLTVVGSLFFIALCAASRRRKLGR